MARRFKFGSRQKIDLGPQYADDESAPTESLSDNATPTNM